MNARLKDLISKEEARQTNTLNLIASENYVSEAARKILATRLSNKYSEGYPGKRYYSGNQYIDEIELLAQKLALEVFRLSPKKWAINVQPLSGTPANLAVYFGLYPKGAKIMAQSLDSGGHLSHGHKLSFGNALWKWVHYFVDQKTEILDYDEIFRLAKKEKPKIIIAGASAYSRFLDFKKFRKIADSCGAYLMTDMAHIAGLVAANVHPSPFPYSDIVTTTTHKTLAGPRGAIIFAKKELMPEINRAVFPGLQGGPHNQQTAAIAAALLEIKTPAFKKYAKQIVKNAKILVGEFQKRGFKIISGGTDNHLFLIDLTPIGIFGAEAQARLEKAGITVNKNIIPFDKRSPFDPSGIRLGTPALSRRGMKEKEMRIIAGWIAEILRTPADKIGPVQNKIRKLVLKLCRQFPIP